MYPYHPQAAGPDCRIAIMPPCEADAPYTTNLAIPALALFQFRGRDTVDFGIDFSQWLAANGGGVLASATWSIASDSPKQPVVDSTAFAPGGKCVIVINLPTNGAPGDAYYLDCTAFISPTTPVALNDVVIPQRSLTRRIHILVVPG